MTFTHAAAPDHLPPEAALCIFRIVEESLTNIGKHSRAATAQVDLTIDESGSRLKIEDQGVGFDPAILETRAGLGFVSMRERLRLVQGTIRIDSAPSKGTRIDVWVPRFGTRDEGFGTRLESRIPDPESRQNLPQSPFRSGRVFQVPGRHTWNG